MKKLNNLVLILLLLITGTQSSFAMEKLDEEEDDSEISNSMRSMSIYSKKYDTSATIGLNQTLRSAKFFTHDDDLYDPNQLVVEVNNLLNEGADPNSHWFERDSFKEKKPLHYACEKGLKGVVTILLDKKVDVNCRYRHANGRTPLMFACLEGFTEIAKLLLENGADANTSEYVQDPGEIFESNNVWFFNSFWVSVSKLGLVKWWRAMDYNSNTALLHNACYNNHSDIVELLLKYNPDATIKERVIVFVTDQKIIKMLIESFKDYPLVDIDLKGNSTLHWACENNEEEWIIGYLDKNLGELARTCSSLKCNTQESKPFWLLLGGKNAHANLKALIYPKNNAGETPIDLARKKGFSTIVDLLDSFKELEEPSKHNNSSYVWILAIPATLFIADNLISHIDHSFTICSIEQLKDQFSRCPIVIWPVVGLAMLIQRANIPEYRSSLLKYLGLPN